MFTFHLNFPVPASSSRSKNCTSLRESEALRAWIAATIFSGVVAFSCAIGKTLSWIRPGADQLDPERVEVAARGVGEALSGARLAATDLELRRGGLEPHLETWPLLPPTAATAFAKFLDRISDELSAAFVPELPPVA